MERKTFGHRMTQNAILTVHLSPSKHILWIPCWIGTKQVKPSDSNRRLFRRRRLSSL